MVIRMKSPEFIPDYTNLLDVLSNRRPPRLPVYEHHIDAPFISKVLRENFDSSGLKPAELAIFGLNSGDGSSSTFGISLFFSGWGMIWVTRHRLCSIRL